MLIKTEIRNNFRITTAQTITVSGGTLTKAYKSITFPIITEFLPTDYGEDLFDIVLAEREKAIGKPFDAETTKYLFTSLPANNNQGLLINFKFWNSTALTYNIDYSAADFTSQDIKRNRNGFKKSFFRLYFYDSNTGETNNLIFTEDINIYNTTTPTIPFNRLYWLRNDDFFVKNNLNRTIYMDARFFNAKTGKVSKFINIPDPIPVPIPVKIEDYSDPNNRDWRTSAIKIINPKLNNGEFNFEPVFPFGANKPTSITMSEFILK